MEGIGTTLTHHIRASERLHPGATGGLTLLLQELTVAFKVISREVNKAGLLEEVLGLTGDTNVHGEHVQKLDRYANETLVRLLGRSGSVALMASEEVEEPIRPSNVTPDSRYVVLFDPLDGSSNIDTNASIGTIFSIHRRRAMDAEPGPADLVRAGHEQVVAGYVIYGSSTVLVYTAGDGVHGFTLDPTVGEFLLSHPGLRCPEQGSIYSVNEGNSARWSDALRALLDWFKSEDKPSGRPYSGRYIGSLVADFHRTLIKGGIFMYPGDRKHPDGKLRLLYEAAPLAYICEQAGGSASNGRQRILDLEPTELHQRTPLYLGSSADVARAEALLADRQP